MRCGHKEISFAFVIDYSMGPDGQLVCYEVQDAMSQLFKNVFDKKKTLKEIQTQTRHTQ